MSTYLLLLGVAWSSSVREYFPNSDESFLNLYVEVRFFLSSRLTTCKGFGLVAAQTRPSRDLPQTRPFTCH